MQEVIEKKKRKNISVYEKTKPTKRAHSRFQLCKKELMAIEKQKI